MRTLIEGIDIPSLRQWVYPSLQAADESMDRVGDAGELIRLERGSNEPTFPNTVETDDSPSTHQANPSYEEACTRSAHQGANSNQTSSVVGSDKGSVEGSSSESPSDSQAVDVQQLRTPLASEQEINGARTYTVGENSPFGSSNESLRRPLTVSTERSERMRKRKRNQSEPSKSIVPWKST